MCSSLLQAQNKLVSVLPQATGNGTILTFGGNPLDVVRDEGAGPLITNQANYRVLRPLSDLMRPLNIGIAVQLSALPIASPASGVIFKEDPVTGAALPSSTSLGPILTERAETIGKGRFYVGYTRQQFRFDKFEGQKIGDFNTLYRGGEQTNIVQGGVRRTTSPMTIGTQVDLRLDQNVIFLTYGLTNRLDISAAITAIQSSISAQTYDARILNTGDPTIGDTCWCAQTLSFQRSLTTFNPSAGQWGTGGFFTPGILGRSSLSSNGIGDLLLRAKGTLLEQRFATIAAGVDFRLPTGDAEDYHGAGAAGIKPFVALSVHSGRLGAVQISPHVNLGFQWNGDSILAGDPLENRKAKLPNQFTYAAGAEVGITRHFTLALDYLGTRLLDANRLFLENAASPNGRVQGTGLALAPEKSSFSMNNMAAGFKTKIAGNLIATANMLIALDDHGLRDKVIPLFGLGYTF